MSLALVRKIQAMSILGEKLGSLFTGKILSDF